MSTANQPPRQWPRDEPKVTATASEQAENARLVAAAVAAGRIYGQQVIRDGWLASLDSKTGTALAEARAKLAAVDVGAKPPVAQASAPARAAALARPSRLVKAQSRFGNHSTVEVDIFAANPLLDDLRQSSPQTYASASRERPAPTLFNSGPLPPFTASGLDPAVLNQLPWFARHQAASEPDRSKVLAMIELAARPDGDVALEMECGPRNVFGGSSTDGAFEYEQRVRDWASGR